MSGQVDSFGAAVFFLFVVGGIALFFAVAQQAIEWLSARRLNRARHDLETYSGVFDRERIGIK